MNTFCSATAKVFLISKKQFNTWTLLIRFAKFMTNIMNLLQLTIASIEFISPYRERLLFLLVIIKVLGIGCTPASSSNVEVELVERSAKSVASNE